MKICLMGNSHLGAMKLGWDALAEACPGVTADFFALGRDTYKHTVLRDGAIVPVKPELVEKLKMFSGGADSIPVGDYDAFAICGLAAGMNRVLRYLQNHAIAGEMTGRSQVVSYGMVQAAWDEYYRSTPMPHLVDMIRQVSDRPVILVMRPMISSSVLEEGSARTRFYEELIAAGEGPYASDLLERLMAPHLPGATVCLRQPGETTVAGVLTRKEFSVGSTTLRDQSLEHDEDDISHMNAEYGAICMAQVLDALGVVPAQARATITEPTE